MVPRQGHISHQDRKIASNAVENWASFYFVANFLYPIILTNGSVVEFQAVVFTYMDMESRQIDTTIGYWLDIDVIKISGHNICFYSALDPTSCF